MAMPMPRTIFVVKGSPNISVPTRMAVIGSKTPSTEAFVAPLSANDLFATILAFIHLFSPPQAILDHIGRTTKKHFFSISMIIFAKICISDDYRGFILLFVHPANFCHTSPDFGCNRSGV